MGSKHGHSHDRTAFDLNFRDTVWSFPWSLPLLPSPRAQYPGGGPGDPRPRLEASRLGAASWAGGPQHGAVHVELIRADCAEIRGTLVGTCVVMGGTVPLELAAFGAAKLGLVDELETCLSQGAPVNATDAEGEIAIQPKQPFWKADRRLAVFG